MSHILILVFLIGNILISLAVSVQLYNLHKSVLDLKTRLNVPDCKNDASVREQMKHEVGAVITDNAAKKSEQAEQQAILEAREKEDALKRESTIFAGETVGEVLSDISNTATSSSAITFTNMQDLEQKIRDTSAVTNTTDSLAVNTEAVSDNTESISPLEDTVSPTNEAENSDEETKKQVGSSQKNSSKKRRRGNKS